MKYYPHHIGDFRSGTVNMTRLERWIYRDMLEMYYDTETPLPRDLDLLCLEIGVRTAEERVVVEGLLKYKFILGEDGYRHIRCEDVLDEYRQKAEIAKANGKLGGRPPKANGTDEKPSGFQSGSYPDATGNQDETGSQANQEPITNNQINPLVGAKAPPCPHLEIIDLYNEILPELQAVIPERWNGTRKTHLQARWRESPKHQNLEFWRKFFTVLRNYGWYLGQNDSGWKANLGWIVEKRNFDNLVEKFVSDARRSGVAA